MALAADSRAGNAGQTVTMDRAVRLWLLAVAFLILIMVGVGGATRLTGSGLSITEWQPILGAIPPLNDTHWQEAFAKYQQIPQYHQINKGMSLEAFKAIYWWEWSHRLLGRLIGIVFAIPLVWFWWRGALGRDLKWKLAGLLALGAAQGAMGWYMVMSGLVDRVSVSHYRLAAHMGLAILIFGVVLWIALGVGHQRPGSSAAAAVPHSQQRFGGVLAAAVFVQILLGALVAGLKAGLTYNTWPLMDGSLVPDGLLTMSPWYINFFDNVTTVQFDHRMMAYAVAATAVLHWSMLRRMP
ncbi:MAG: COX15/CtaA family protein, partial [Hyphomicrobiaceae bacterium]